MTKRRITNAAADRLGKRLRTAGLADPADRVLLDALLADAFDALDVVSAELRAEMPEVPFTTRVKTHKTLIEKLEREPSMALSKMQDLAGLRIVGDMDLDEQDALVERCSAILGGGRPVDRRVKPMYGYRAVHLVVERRQIRVELQVRTLFQDQWAQLVERLGDVWGRQLRYGEGPADPERAQGHVTRAFAWRRLQELGEAMAGMQELIRKANRGEISDATAQAEVDRLTRLVAEIGMIFRRTAV